MNPLRISEIREERREKLLREGLMSDEFMDFIRENMEPYNQLMAYYRCAIMEIETKFRVLNEEFSLQYDRNPIESIKSRIKSPDSLMRKLKTRGIPMDLESIEENIDDIAGLRIICSFPEDIYVLADCLLRQDDVTLIKRKDYIENPKPSGYRSLHLIVSIPIFLKNEKRSMKVEVQLRTIAMDFWASLEHKLKYKKDLPADRADAIAAELKECAETSAALDCRMQAIRQEILELNAENPGNAEEGSGRRSRNSSGKDRKKLPHKARMIIADLNYDRQAEKRADNKKDSRDGKE